MSLLHQKVWSNCCHCKVSLACPQNMWLSAAFSAAHISVCLQAAPRLHEFKNQELVNMLWGLATLRNVFPVSDDLAQELDTSWAQAVMSVLPSMRGQFQHMANAVWAFAHLRLDPLNGRCSHPLPSGQLHNQSVALPSNLVHSAGS